MTTTQLMINAFLKRNSVIICPAGATALSMTDSDWKTLIKARRVEALTHNDCVGVAERFYTGAEHGLVFQEYISEDEYTADIDPEVDRAVFEEWRDAFSNADLGPDVLMSV